MIGDVFKKQTVQDRMAYDEALLESGKKFIQLKLVNFTKNRIQGAIILDPVKTRDDNGLVKFTFVERGGRIVFVENQSGTSMLASILDCEHNRKFLASHTTYNYWIIVDKKIRSEIEELASEFATRAVRVKKDAPENPEKLMSDVELGNLKARVAKEEAERTIRRNKLSRTGGKRKKSITSPKKRSDKSVKPLVSEVEEGLGVAQKVDKSSVVDIT